MHFLEGRGHVETIALFEEKFGRITDETVEAERKGKRFGADLASIFRYGNAVRIVWKLSDAMKISELLDKRLKTLDAIEYSPSESYGFKAAVYMQMGRPADAEVLYRKACDMETNPFILRTYLYSLGNSLDVQERHEDSIAVRRKALHNIKEFGPLDEMEEGEQDGDILHVYESMLQSYISLGSLRDARRTLKKAIEYGIDPIIGINVGTDIDMALEPVNSLIRCTRQQLEKSGSLRTIACYEAKFGKKLPSKLVSADGSGVSSEFLWWALAYARALEKACSYTRALQFTELLEAALKGAVAAVNKAAIAETLMIKGRLQATVLRFDEADATFRELMTIEDSVALRERMAEILMVRERHNEAASLLEGAFELGGDLSGAHLLMADCQIALEDLSKAEKFLNMTPPNEPKRQQEKRLTKLRDVRAAIRVQERSGSRPAS